VNKLKIILEDIVVYPIKSLPGIKVNHSILKPGGGLQWDRQWRLIDANGKTINGKRDPRVHLVKASYDLDSLNVRLAIKDESPAEFSLRYQLKEMGDWFAAKWDEEIKCVFTNDHFSDDQKASGPTIAGIASLDLVRKWFGWSTLEEAYCRFRPNLIISGTEPFAEDRLLMCPKREILVGGQLLHANNICKRCVVPSRNPFTGDHTNNFAKIFIENRKRDTPKNVPLEELDHFYRFAINTRVLALTDSGIIKKGDSVQCFTG